MGHFYSTHTHTKQHTPRLLLLVSSDTFLAKIENLRAYIKFYQNFYLNDAIWGYLFGRRARAWTLNFQVFLLFRLQRSTLKSLAISYLTLMLVFSAIILLSSATIRSYTHRLLPAWISAIICSSIKSLNLSLTLNIAALVDRLFFNQNNIFIFLRIFIFKIREIQQAFIWEWLCLEKAQILLVYLTMRSYLYVIF